VLGGLGRLLARVLGEDIELKILAACESATVRADQGQVDQVILNLVVNARDAMPQGGKLTVACSIVDLDDEYARDHAGVTPGPYVMLSVNDTGVGMSKATQARVFEPFFTTKEQGKGTGLGLSTVFGIVKQSGGHIWLYSEPGMGTTFKIYLPHVVGTVDPSRDMSLLPVVGGHETILLVEDEDQVRNVAMTILKQLGYRVLEAATPEQALALCVDHNGRIDLLLTDVVMPRLSGREVADRVSSLRPDLTVLFMSGYTNDAMLQHGVLDEGMAFVQKPLTPAVLARKVREVLDRTRNS
jgi:two-component system, cell cycle sensor histidine kinase and response regulator CckA